MCRHLCYLGPELRLAELLYHAPHSLAEQSYAPRDMRGGGSVNADGFGAAWYGRSGLTRYRRAGPIWQDEGFRSVAEGITTGAVLAAVRNATVGLPVGEGAAAPFVAERWAFSLNGWVPGWPDSLVPLADSLGSRALLQLDALTDAALLWAWLAARLCGGQSPTTAIRELVEQVLELAPAARLNLLLTDGRTAWASTVTHALSVRTAPTIVASEPLDDSPAWQPIGDGRLVIATAEEVRVEALASATPY